jgi:hercynylcysteine S-oxide lyase
VTGSDTLADQWRAARPPMAGLHLDNAACSRQSLAVIEAAAQHARNESELGGYVAAEAAVPVLDAGRAAFAALAGMTDAASVFTTGSLNALDLLLGGWPADRRRVACLPGEYGPNLAMMAAHGFQHQLLPTLDDGRLALDDAALALEADPPDLVHLTAVGSHSGVVQPLAMVARLCRELELPLVVDAAQALGQVDCAVGADVTYCSSRKWIAGPRGVGMLAVRRELLDGMRPRLAAPEWLLKSSTVDQQLEFGEANIAARVGFSLALGEYLAYGPLAVRARLAELGGISRTLLGDVTGWAVIEEAEEPSAITTLAPVDGADPLAVREWLLAERRILTTFAGVQRAPLELTGPVLRISPHVDTSAADLETFAEALIAATAATA